MQKLACSRPLWVAWQDRWRATLDLDCAEGSALVLGCTLSTSGCSRTEGLHWYWLLSGATPEPAVQTRSLHLLCECFMHLFLGCADAGEQSCLHDVEVHLQKDNQQLCVQVRDLSRRTWLQRGSFRQQGQASLQKREVFFVGHPFDGDPFVGPEMSQSFLDHQKLQQNAQGAACIKGEGAWGMLEG